MHQSEVKLLHLKTGYDMFNKNIINKACLNIKYFVSVVEN